VFGKFLNKGVPGELYVVLNWVQRVDPGAYISYPSRYFGSLNEGESNGYFADWGVEAWDSCVGSEVCKEHIEEGSGLSSVSIEYCGEIAHNPVIGVSCRGCRRYCCRGSLRCSWSSSWSAGSPRSSRSARSSSPSRPARGWGLSAHGVV
jgi:hypothetical protein